MKREAAARIYEEIKDMTDQEQLAYWDKASQELQELREKQLKLKEKELAHSK